MDPQSDAIIEFRSARQGDRGDGGANARRLEKIRIALGYEKVRICVYVCVFVCVRECGRDSRPLKNDTCTPPLRLSLKLSPDRCPSCATAAAPSSSWRAR